MIGMGVAFVGYASLGMLENPLSNGMYIAAAFVGAGRDGRPTFRPPP